MDGRYLCPKSEKCQIFGHFFAFFEGDHGKKGSDLLLSKTYFSTFVNQPDESHSDDGYRAFWLAFKLENENRKNINK